MGGGRALGGWVGGWESEDSGCSGNGSTASWKRGQKQRCWALDSFILPACLAPLVPCSTSPYADKGPTWQQAVQWVQEVEVAVGQGMTLMARHDTYSISYSLPPELEEGGKGEAARTASTEITDEAEEAAGPSSQPRPTGVPLVDPAWRAAYDRLQGLNGQLVKACVQNPLEYRAVAQAALQFAARPHDLGLDTQQAAEFCVRMMG